MDNQIKEGVGRFLGRTSSGELMMPYETPDKHDPSLLVPIPREINRNLIGLDLNTVQGYDVWHAYEFSYLLPNNQPRTGVLKIAFPYDTKVMIESKSFKLYLNSFDFENFTDDDTVEITIESELRTFTNSRVDVKFHPAASEFLDSTNIFNILNCRTNCVNFYNADEEIIPHIDVTRENPDVLVTYQHNPMHNAALFYTANLRSACEITNQKDTGHCLVAMNGETVFDNEELARYIFSMRNSQHFHENVTEIIYKTLWDKFKPDLLLVANFYNRRGGLDIHPIRYSKYDFYKGILADYHHVNKLYKVNSQL